jgi:hypothetical protein
MCNCAKTPGFKEKLALAKKQTEKTGETHVVYVHKASNTVFMRKQSDLNDSLGICCYFLPDGTEVEYKSTPEESKEAEALTIEIFVARTIKGEKMESPEEIQFYQNNKKEIEKELKKAAK